LAEWKWEYEPMELAGWIPDFCVEFGCGHSECSPTHTLLVDVKPFYQLSKFQENASWKMLFDGNQPDPELEFTCSFGDSDLLDKLGVDAIAFFGNNPSVTGFAMVHGAGGSLWIAERGVVSAGDSVTG